MKSASAKKAVCPLRSHCWRSVWKRASSLAARFVGCRGRCRRRSPSPGRSRRRRGPSAASRATIRSSSRWASSNSLRGRLADLRIVEDRRILALQLPGQEERRPVDVRRRARSSGKSIEHAAAEERRRGDPHRLPSRSETAWRRPPRRAPAATACRWRYDSTSCRCSARFAAIEQRLRRRD